ncbi:type I-E CRISPR-associated protein Cse1/CasA [Lactiplantibacillus modestisalitolerans]|uniref:Type I-E CRISPR-associated protein Cse1/CasA n=1 Tax=Lactiplantibacillus modestisalitolerans TaxID=1457219 RepID=A0ABV5WRH1_9LACO|nr:type I-E CRISPR-associated protein Cse1/CasA [Lactiplantibacillus modestisalitolerans]
MEKPTFNLTTDPWIKVTECHTNAPRTVSLIELFEHAQDYRQLAGDMRTQDLAVMRVLLAILTTVYSRYDGNGQPYRGIDKDPVHQRKLDVDPEAYEDALLKTWEQVFKMGHFSANVVQYLHQFADRFDLFGAHPFYQVTTEDYDAVVAENKRVALGKGTVAIKQLNRRVSESNNTPAIFASRADMEKNQLTLAELARWLITYQNFAGTTDKTKVETADKFSSSMGWLYKLNSVYADGQTVFETLMLNLVLINEKHKYAPQHPVWECDDMQAYVDRREMQRRPDNVADLYTNWARLLHIEWDEQQQPTIFSAALPGFESDNVFIEPMTIWRRDKKTEDDIPATRSSFTMSRAMWRNFGSYVGITPTAGDDLRQPGLVWWLNLLKSRKILAASRRLSLASVTFVGGGAPANLPMIEYHDDIQIMAGVIFDAHTDDYWPVYIDKVITMTQKIGTDFYSFAMSVGTLRRMDPKPFAAKLSDQFYGRLNEPFKDWLVSLTATADRDQSVLDWKLTARQIALAAAKDVMNHSSPRDISGVVGEYGLENIFTLMSMFQGKVKRDLKLQEEGIKQDES